jgi:type VI protein secretion system component VasF
MIFVPPFLGSDVRGTTVRRNSAAWQAWLWLIGAGFAVLLVGIVFGLQKTGPLCGSPLIPDSRAAEAFDALHRGAEAAAACYRAIGAAAVPTWILIALAVVLVLAGVTVRIVLISRSAGRGPEARGPEARGTGGGSLR